MFSEVTVRLVLELDKRVPEHRPAEDVDSHGSKVAARLFRFLFEFFDPVLAICHNDAEPARFFDRNGHCRNGDIRLIRLMKIEHNLVIHLINMIA